MRRYISALFFVVIMVCASVSSANVYVVDTGTPSVTSSGNSLNRTETAQGDDFQWLAGRFTLDQDYTIRTLEGFFSYNFIAGDVTIAIYGTDGTNSYPDSSALYFSDTFFLTTPASSGWYGLMNENLNLLAGTYWISFEIRDPSLVYSAMGYNPPNPLDLYRFTNEDFYPDWSSVNINPFGVRLGTEAIPEPSAVFLFSMGFIYFLRLRRK